MDNTRDHEELVRAMTAGSWSTIPPFWHYMRSTLHRIAREDYGITSTQLQVLRRIREEKKRTVSELSDCMYVSRPAVSRAVDELVNRGLLERKRDSIDRRIVFLTPSERGGEVISQIHAKNNMVMREIFSPLDNAELECLDSAFRIIEKMLNNFGGIKQP